MPKLKPRREGIGALTNPQWIELVFGPSHKTVFASDGERRESWRIHGQSIIDELAGPDWNYCATTPWAQTEYGEPGRTRTRKLCESN